MGPTGSGHPLTSATLVALYRERFDSDPEELEPLRPDGSARRYVRLRSPGGHTVVGVIGNEVPENRAFLSFTETFRSLGMPVPDVLAVSADETAYLLTDLGDTTLFDAIEELRDGADPGATLPAEARRLYREVVRWLPRFQVEGGRAIDFSQAYPRAAFDRQSIRWDLNYFKYHFLKLAHIPFDEARLEEDFRTFAAFLASAPAEGFLYRDFQSRNVMIVDGAPWFIDYQGGRKGALQYDLASLLYDAKADLSDATRAELIEEYLDALAELVPVDRAAFLGMFRPFVLVRILQAMGAYGYRGFYERKPRFLASVPFAVGNIRSLLDAGPLNPTIPELEAVLRRICDDTRFTVSARPGAGLTVLIGSFSYRRGIPVDHEGHGGGFVFDCRGIQNPGRQAAYRDLTGLDPEVGAFLEALPEVADFWESVKRLVEGHVDTFQRRGLDHMTVQFGCTGGQHRSVFFAERLAAHLETKVRVDLKHREREHWPPRPERREATPSTP